MRCEHAGIYARSFQDGSVELQHYTCHQWKCASCATAKAIELRHHIRAGCPEWFLVLTVPYAEGESITALDVKTRHQITLLFQAYRRAFPNHHFAYCVVPEPHKRSQMHYNVFIRGTDPPIGWLWRHWHKRTGSVWINLTRIKKPGAVFRYAAKYVTKDLARIKRGKRYWCSKNWLVLRKPPDVIDNRLVMWRANGTASLVTICEALDQVRHPYVRDGPARIRFDRWRGSELPTVELLLTDPTAWLLCAAALSNSLRFVDPLLSKPPPLGRSP